MPNSTTVASPAPSSSPRAKLADLQKQLNTCFYEREEEIEGLLTAALARQHVLLLGLPGTAKSNLISVLSRALGGSHFQWLLTKFSTPEEIFGPISVSKLLDDEYVRNTNGKLPEAEVAFLDEIFKANSSILNSLLTLLNEGLFYNGNVPISAPLQMLVGASNELPEDSSLDALFDRFTLRYWVTYMENESNLRSLLLSTSEPAVTVRFTAGELQILQEEAAAVEFGQLSADSLLAIRTKLGNDGIGASDRRWKSLVRTLKAYAYLQGDDEVTEEHFSILAPALWVKQDQIEKVRKTLRTTGNPVALKSQEILASARDSWESVARANITEQSWPGTASLAQNQLKQMKSELTQLASQNPGRRGSKATAAAKEVDDLLKKVNAAIQKFYDLD